jgi:hypothetical protein
MPRSPRRRLRVRATAAELRVAAQGVAPLIARVMKALIERTAQYAEPQTAAPRRPRGRGSQLVLAEQLAVFYYAVTFDSRASELSRVFGYDLRTIRRLLRTAKFAKFHRYAQEESYRETKALISAYGGVRRWVRDVLR